MEDRLLKKLSEIKSVLEENEEKIRKATTEIKQRVSGLESKLNELENKFRTFKSVIKNEYTDALLEHTPTEKEFAVVKTMLQEREIQHSELRERIELLIKKVKDLEEKVGTFITKYETERISERLLKIEQIFEKREMEDTIKKIKGDMSISKAL